MTVHTLNARRELVLDELETRVASRPAVANRNGAKFDWMLIGAIVISAIIIALAIVGIDTCVNVLAKHI